MRMSLVPMCFWAKVRMALMAVGATFLKDLEKKSALDLLKFRFHVLAVDVLVKVDGVLASNNLLEGSALLLLLLLGRHFIVCLRKRKRAASVLNSQWRYKSAGAKDKAR